MYLLYFLYICVLLTVYFCVLLPTVNAFINVVLSGRRDDVVTSPSVAQTERPSEQALRSTSSLSIVVNVVDRPQQSSRQLRAHPAPVCINRGQRGAGPGPGARGRARARARTAHAGNNRSHDSTLPGPGPAVAFGSAANTNVVSSFSCAERRRTAHASTGSVLPLADSTRCCASRRRKPSLENK